MHTVDIYIRTIGYFRCLQTKKMSSFSSASRRGRDVETEEWLRLCRTADTVLGPSGTNLIPLPPLSAVSSSHQTPFRMLSSSEAAHGISRGAQGMSADDVIMSSQSSRDHYQHPGFCSGCRRSTGCTFCYGCERDSEPQYVCVPIAWHES